MAAVSDKLYSVDFKTKFKIRYVEVGRVAYIAHGDDKGKLCVIVDVVDQNRALIDGPCSNVNRKMINFKALHLTKLKIAIPRSCKNRFVRKAWEKANMTEQWNNSTWAKKIANRETRAKLTDFDRFKLMIAKKNRNQLIAAEFGKLKKAWAKAPKKDTKKKAIKKK